MTVPNLTDRQREIFAFIGRYLGVHGSAPTIREIGAEFGIKSPNGVLCHVRALERKGLLAHRENTSRGLSPVVQAGHCPCCGQRLPETPAVADWDPIELGA